jgi:glycolate oxidase FAD binding subunit
VPASGPGPGGDDGSPAQSRDHPGADTDASSPATPADADCAERLAEQVRLAIARRRPLCIAGSGSKHFLGRAVDGETLHIQPHCGVVHYQPQELVVTARAGTPLARLDETLGAAGQYLPFDPPRFAGHGTLGGAIACGLSGPARPFTGAARDFVLGVRIINGRGQILHFGGEVMKNVAGYDLSRLLTGSFGSLGVLLDVSLKVLPAPPATATVVFEAGPSEAIALFARLRSTPLPLAGACHLDALAHVRLAGSEAAVAQGVDTLTRGHGGIALDPDEDKRFWPALRDHRLPFFDDPRALYRLSLPPTRAPLSTPGRCLIDWAGGQRWLLPEVGLAEVRGEARALGGHATRFRRALEDRPAHGSPAPPGSSMSAGSPTAPPDPPTASPVSDVFHPLTPAVHALHVRLKAAFDPHGVLNPGRQYPGI